MVDGEELFAGDRLGREVFLRVVEILSGFESIEVKASKSQVAFRRERGFAYLWKPGQWLAHPNAEMVVSIALGRHDPSPRFKEVAHTSSRHWMHHLEIHDLDELDDEVSGWLIEAAERAG